MSKTRSRRIGVIRTWSSRLRGLLGVALVSLPVLALLAFAGAVAFGGPFHFGGPEALDLSAMRGAGLAAVALATAVGLAVHLLPPHYLRRLFALWEEGEVLTRAAGGEVRPAGWSLLLAGGVTLLVGMVLDEAARVAEEAELTV